MDVELKGTICRRGEYISIQVENPQTFQVNFIDLCMLHMESTPSLVTSLVTRCRKTLKHIITLN